MHVQSAIFELAIMRGHTPVVATLLVVAIAGGEEEASAVGLDAVAVGVEPGRALVVEARGHAEGRVVGWASRGQGPRSPHPLRGHCAAVVEGSSDPTLAAVRGPEKITCCVANPTPRGVDLSMRAHQGITR